MVKLIGVSFDTDKEKLKAFRTENEIKWSMFCEYKKWKETNISKAYNIQWIPTMYLIDPEGKVAYTTVVAANMEKKLAELVAAGKMTPYIQPAEYPGGKKALGQGYLRRAPVPRGGKEVSCHCQGEAFFHRRRGRQFVGYHREGISGSASLGCSLL